MIHAHDRVTFWAGYQSNALQLVNFVRSGNTSLQVLGFGEDMFISTLAIRRLFDYEMSRGAAALVA